MYLNNWCFINLFIFYTFNVITVLAFSFFRHLWLLYFLHKLIICCFHLHMFRSRQIVLRQKTVFLYFFCWRIINHNPWFTGFWRHQNITIMGFFMIFPSISSVCLWNILFLWNVKFIRFLHTYWCSLLCPGNLCREIVLQLRGNYLLLSDRSLRNVLLSWLMRLFTCISWFG